MSARARAGALAGDARGGGQLAEGSGQGRSGEAPGPSPAPGVGVCRGDLLDEGGRMSPSKRALVGLCQGVCARVCMSVCLCCVCV